MLTRLSFPSPSLVANLWDVTDKDIDRISEAVFASLHLDGQRVAGKKDDRETKPTTTAQAIGQARDSCKLRFLTGAAPVVYGLPMAFF